jgi:exosortase/archaeosortase family protein
MVKRSQRKKVVKDLFLFLIKLNLLLIPFYLIIILDLSFYPFQIAFANFLAFILKSLNYPVYTSDFFLFVGESKFPIDISIDCIGWKGMYSLFALVFATPGNKKDKLKFLLVWMPLLFVINIFRTLITILVGLNFGLQYLDFFHTFLWQEVMIFSVIGIWYLWLRRGKLNIRGISNILYSRNRKV